MLKHGFEVQAHAQPWTREIDLLITKYEAGKRFIVGLSTIEFTDDMLGRDLGPTLSLRRDVAQILMDELWQAGLRPSEGTGSAGALASTQAHLEDMRALAFKALGTDMPRK
jgi:hypothetical protein